MLRQSAHVLRVAVLFGVAASVGTADADQSPQVRRSHVHHGKHRAHRAGKALTNRRFEPPAFKCNF